MTWMSGEIVGLLTFLLPGFVAAAVFYSLTSHPKPNAFDRFVQALIFTVVGQAIIAVAVLSLSDNAMASYANWGEDRQLVLSVSVAVLLGLIATYFSNNDSLHSLLRYLRITKETSYQSEWYSAFSRHAGCYVVLHLEGERRLYGWPVEWPSAPDNGHFRIGDAEWLVDDEGGQTQVLVKGVSAILVPVSTVEMVEFLRGGSDRGLKE